MRFDLTGPCSNCPFLKVGGIRIHPARAREIAQGQLNGPDERTFPCHKTTVEGETIDPDSGETVQDMVWAPTSQYCGGALAFASKLESYNQVLQIAQRLHWWDPSQIDPKALAVIVDSVLDMAHVNTTKPLTRKQTPTYRATPKRRQ